MASLKLFKKIMDAKATAQVTSDEVGPVEIGSAIEISFYIVFGAGTNAGGVQIESSPIAGYSGTWAAEGSAVAWAAASRVHKVSITGVSYIYRARISTGVTGGTVDVYAIANG